MKSVAFLAVLLLISYSSYCDGDGFKGIRGLDEDTYYRICGVWDTDPDMNRIEGQYSWGRGEEILNHSVVIDLGYQPPYLLVEGLATLRIVAVERIREGTFKLIVEREHYSGTRIESLTLYLAANNDGTICFDESFREFGQFGKDHPYFRLSGPSRNGN
jgi:hypothetical protein